MKRKRFFFFVIMFLVISVIIVTVVFVGAKKNKEKSVIVDNDSSSSNDYVSNPVSPLNPSIHTGRKVSGSPFIGDFLNSYVAANFSDAIDVFKEESLIPTIGIKEDGTFILTINTIETGLVSLSGTLEVDDTTATFTIVTRDKEGFLGDNVESFSFRLVGTDDMKYIGEQLGSITTGDIFTRITD